MELRGLFFLQFYIVSRTLTVGGFTYFQGRTPDKMASFTMVRKKTPFQKHRDEEDAKKKVIFVASFLVIT